ncbi:MAG TPA: HlyD family secretion protein [Gallionellaceae bacterium]|nr:HlyD family secretion protein [Gallionellaceae bacterium]
MSHRHQLHETKQPLHKNKRFLLLVAVPFLVGLISLFVYLLGGRYVETDNAYIKAQKVPVSAVVSGAVKEVMVGENQAVQAGQILYRLEQAPFRIAVAKAEAKLNQVRNELAALKISYREKQAEITLARSNYEYALKDQQRQSDLASKNFISASKLDDVKHNTDVNAQKIALLEQEMKRIAESLGGNPDTAVESQSAYHAALAELEQARLDLSNTEVRASMGGRVSKPPKVGQFISTGSIAMILVADDMWIEANFTEADLTYVYPGQVVKISIDTFPDSKLQGVVESLSPATGAEFSLIPAQNSTGNWVKIAQRVPVRIRLDAATLPALRAGLSSWVEIDTGHRRRILGISL